MVFQKNIDENNLNSEETEELNKALQLIEHQKLEIKFLHEKIDLLEKIIFEEREDKKVFRELAEQKLLTDLSTNKTSAQTKKWWKFYFLNKKRDFWYSTKRYYL